MHASIIRVNVRIHIQAQIPSGCFVLCASLKTTCRGCVVHYSATGEIRREKLLTSTALVG